MKICVFGAASDMIDKKYIERTEDLCRNLAQNGHELVFGAGANGIMGAAARGFKSGGGKVYGIIPHFFKTETVEAIYEECDDIIYTDSMRERKKQMEDMADAFVIAPGGIGTLEEMFEVITLKQLARHKKPIAFYNVYNYYDKLMEFMKYSESERFIREGCHNLYISSGDDTEVIEYIEDDTPFEWSLKDLK